MSARPEKYIAKSQAIAARLLGGEMMIMSAKDSSLYSLNPVATCIWQAADGVTPLSEIVSERICALFDVDAETAYGDAEAFAEALAQHGILRISSAAIQDEPSPAIPAAGSAQEQWRKPGGLAP